MTPLWGMSQRLPRRIGPLRAKEMMYTGRVVTGNEAVEIGLANECVADDTLIDRTIEIARQIVGNSWHTLRADKMLVNKGLNLPLGEGLVFERENSPGADKSMQERIKGFSKS